MQLKNICYYLFSVMLLAIGCNEEKNIEISLKDTYKDKFVIGMAMNEDQILGIDTPSVKVIKQHCSSITAENCMKSLLIHPEEDHFDFELSDKFVAFGEDNKMKVIGHTLIWHSQAPDWFFVDSEGNDVSREVLIARMKNHIHTVVGRYKGKVQGWDVVNEAIEDDGSWRKSKFYKIIGAEYISLAFQFAHEADPEAELYYNDYNMAHEGKRNGVVKLVQTLQEKNINIDGIGMQTHSGLYFPDIEEQEKSIVAFANLGVQVMITELDVTALPLPGNISGANVSDTVAYKAMMNPYPNALPDSVYMVQKEKIEGLFRLFNKYHENIDRVTFWGVSDNQSWKNNWPIKGRTDYALFFDRDFNAKPFVNDILEMAKTSAD